MSQQNQPERQEMDQAQRAVSHSLSAFESAMDELARSVDGVGEVFERFMGIARLPKEELKKFADRAREVAEDVKKNPQPYVLALGTVIAFLAFRSWRKGRTDAPLFTGDAAY